MKKICLLGSLLIFGLGNAVGQTAKKSALKKQADVAAIKKMCGCFEITFAFGETFSPDTAYQFHENYLAHGLEWVVLEEETPNKLVLQHLLIINDSTTIKHWRQDWLYENTDLFRFDRDNRWVRTQLPKNEVKGQWTQKVYQVDDSPRYEGSATWVHVDGRHFWENTTDAPLPRREYTKRSDYNVMRRNNRHEITPEGWVHEQNNDKVLRSEKGDKLLAQERGWNPYVRVPDHRCKSAQTWWSKNQQHWAVVRAEWAKVYADSKTDLTLLQKVDGKALWQHLSGSPDQEIGKILRSFVAGQQGMQKGGR
jgi:hypothetical protein